MTRTNPVVDIDLLRSWVGRERTSQDVLGLFPAQALSAALDRKATLAEHEALPAAWQWIYFLEAPLASATGIDGHPALGGFLPPVPLPRRMWASGHMEIVQPLQLAKPAVRKSVIKAVDAKSGRSGTLVFVTLEHQLSQGGELCVREEQNLVYREMPATAQALPPGEMAPRDADWVRLVRADPVLLFRYSALTYNGHRIHYDRGYAVESEFYPALVVHGPLLATLLLELLYERVPGASVASFGFKAVRPTFDSHPFKLCGKRDGNTVSLWTVDHEGYVGMTATVSLK